VTTTDYATILWTGGYDSTALVLKAIREEREFETLSFALGNNEGQAKREQEARDRMRSYITSVIPDSKWRGAKTLQVPSMSICCRGGCPQPVIWIALGLIESVGGILEIGWVKGDDVWHYKTEIQRVFASASSVMRDDKCKLSIPFEWSNKSNLLDEYFWHYQKLDPLYLLSMVSTTETGECWMTGTCHKSEDMRRLWVEAKKREANAGVTNALLKCEVNTVGIKELVPSPDLM
jgi:hypothetical protein